MCAAAAQVRLGGHSLTSLPAGAPPRSFPEAYSHVLTTSDGAFERCFVVHTPPRAPRTAADGRYPVLLWFHGLSDGANGCGWRADNVRGRNLAEVAWEAGVALVCIEALAYDGRPNGQQRGVGVASNARVNASFYWAVPEVQSAASGGTRCAKSDSRELVMAEKVLEWLADRPDTYNLDKLYLAGESVGGAAAQYLGVCLHAATRWRPKALSTHSTGLKVKGDGIEFGRMPMMPWHHVAECDGCGSFPIVLMSEKEGGTARTSVRSGGARPLPPLPPVKLCAFDSAADWLMSFDGVPLNFTASTLNLVRAWRAAGGRAEASIAPTGFHVEVHSHTAPQSSHAHRAHAQCG